MKQTGFFFITVFAFALLSQASAHGQTPPTSVTTKGKLPVVTKTGAPPAFQLPDLMISRIDLEGEIPGGKSSCMVQVTNIGRKNYDAADIKGPIKVWLRVWKPANPQPFTETEPKATSFIWGGTLQIDGLEAGKSKQLWFVVSTPPNGWEIGCNSGKWGTVCNWLKPKDPLRLHIVAWVDPSNTVKESNEANNHGFPTVSEEPFVKAPPPKLPF